MVAYGKVIVHEPPPLFPGFSVLGSVKNSIFQALLKVYSFGEIFMLHVC